MQWKRKTTPEQYFAAWYRSDDDARGTAAEFEEAVDTLATVLRAWAQTPLGLDATADEAFRDTCEAWVRHVLVGSPSPNRTAIEGPADSDVREWTGLRHFAIERRQQEQRQVTGAIGDLRQAIWAFIDTFGALLVSESQTDQHIVGQLDQLREVVDSGSPAEIRQGVVTRIAQLATYIEARRAEQRARLDELGKRVSALAVELQETRRESQIDTLTRLANRAALEAFLKRSANLKHIIGQPATLLMIDVDHFKWINDTFGHPTGDRLLVALADCIVRNFPRRNDCVARYGGDEFAVVLSDTPLSAAIPLAKRLLQAVRDLSLPHQGEQIRVTVSIGLSDVARNETVESWRERADEALYTAKRSGRDRIASIAASEQPLRAKPLDSTPVTTDETTPAA